MLELLLDRRVAKVDLPNHGNSSVQSSKPSSLADQLDPNIRWIAVSSHRELDPRFVVSGTAGDFAIWKKADAGEVPHLATPPIKKPDESHFE